MSTLKGKGMKKFLLHGEEEKKLLEKRKASKNLGGVIYQRIL